MGAAWRRSGSAGGGSGCGGSCASSGSSNTWPTARSTGGAPGSATCRPEGVRLSLSVSNKRVSVARSRSSARRRAGVYRVSPARARSARRARHNAPGSGVRSTPWPASTFQSSRRTSRRGTSGKLRSSARSCVHASRSRASSCAGVSARASPSEEELEAEEERERDRRRFFAFFSALSLRRFSPFRLLFSFLCFLDASRSMRHGRRRRAQAE